MRFDDDPKADLWFKMTALNALLGIPVAFIVILACGKFILSGSSSTVINNYSYDQRDMSTHTTTTKESSCVRLPMWIELGCDSEDKGE